MTESNNSEPNPVVRSGKIYKPTKDNKKEIKNKAYWAGFKLWLLLIVVGLVFWIFEMGIDPEEYANLFSVVSGINGFVTFTLSSLLWSVEPLFEAAGEFLWDYVSETGYASEIYWALTGIIGLIVLFILPYIFYPLFYPWARSQIALNHRCAACGKDWTVYWTGNKELYDVGKSYTNSTETEHEIFGKRERTVDKQQEYTDQYFNYEFSCEHCGEVEYRQGVESRLSNEIVTSRSNWQRKS